MGIQLINNITLSKKELIGKDQLLFAVLGAPFKGDAYLLLAGIDELFIKQFLVD